MRTPTLICLAVAAAVLAGCASYGSSGGGMPSPGGGGMHLRAVAVVECRRNAGWNAGRHARWIARRNAGWQPWNARNAGQHWHAGHARRITLDAVLQAGSAG